MSQGSEAAEQMTREAIQISEAAAKLAALGAKNLAALCLALANENQKLRGKTHMNALLRSGKELRVFDLKEQDLTVFKQEAKKYGVLRHQRRCKRERSCGHPGESRGCVQAEPYFRAPALCRAGADEIGGRAVKKSRVPCSAREQIRRARDWLEARESGD